MVFLALFAHACGGGGGRSPTTPLLPTPDPGFPAGTAFTVVSAETDAPVAGARVVIGGRTYTTDGAGRVALQERAEIGALVDVIAPGFLDRQTSLRSRTNSAFSLWPKDSPTGLDEDFTARIVYSTASGEVAVVADQPLNRLREGTRAVSIVPSRELLADERALSTHQEAAARVTAASGNQVVYSVAADAPAGTIRFDTRVDPSDSECTSRNIRAFVSRTVRSGETVGGSVVFCTLAAAYASTVTHELGHTFGLQHSPDGGEVMGPAFSPRRASDFGQRESLVMHLLLRRRAGNRYPDNDRSATAGARSGTVTIFCPE